MRLVKEVLSRKQAYFLLSRNEVLMQTFKEYRKEGRKCWTGRGKPQQSGKKSRLQFVGIRALSEVYESYRDASTGGRAWPCFHVELTLTCFILKE